MCYTEQVNKLLKQFLHAECRVNNLLTVLSGNFRFWETLKSPKKP